MARKTEIIERSVEYGFDTPFPVDGAHLVAMSDIRGANFTKHHRGFTTPAGQWLEVWWHADLETGAVIRIFEDIRALNRR